MLTLVGADRPGIVAGVTRAVFEAGGNLGEASMIRLGGNFTIVMMVAANGHQAELERAVAAAAAALGLHFHMDPLHGDGGLHQHQVPNVQVRVTGADRAGIVAQVTDALAAAGLNILELESDVVGDRKQPLYIMNIQGYSGRTIESLRAAVTLPDQEGIAVDITSVETLIG